MKGKSLAILLGAPKGGAGEEPDGDESSDEASDDYAELARQAFPGEDWTPERVAALKEFVMSCMDKGES